MTLQTHNNYTTLNSYNLSMTLQSCPGLHINMLTDFRNRYMYFNFYNPITLSTCICTQAISRVVSTSYLLSCGFPFVKEGVFTWAQYNPAASWMLKPLSAKMRSTFFIFFQNTTILCDMYIASMTAPCF